MSNLIYATVIAVESFTSPSGQVKPMIKIRIQGEPKLRVVSMITFNNLYHLSIAVGSTLTFKDYLKCSCIIKAELPPDVLPQQKIQYLHLAQECPACHSKAVRYKSNYWCTNIHCSASKEPRLKRVIANSPVNLFYHKQDILKWSKRNPISTIFWDILNPYKIKEYGIPVMDKFKTNTYDEINNMFIGELKKWSTESKLMCLDARISHAQANKLTQKGIVGIDIINKYTVRNMMDLGIGQLEASKIRTMMDYEYNQNLISEILKIEKMVGEKPE